MINEPEPEITGKLFDRTLSARLLRYALPYTRILVASLLLMLLLSLVIGYLPILIQSAVDHYMADDGSGLSEAERFAGLGHTALRYLALVLAAFVLRFGQSYLVTWMGQKIVFDIRSDIYRKVLTLPMRFMDRTAVGRLMTRVSSDVEAMQRMVTEGLVGTISDLFTLFAITGFMFYKSWQLTLALFVFMPLLFFSVAFVNRQIRAAHRTVRRQQSSLNAYLQEMITGMQTVQLFNREPQVIGQFEDQSTRMQDAGVHSIRCMTRLFPSIEVFNGLAFAAILITGSWLIERGTTAVTIGVLVAFLLYIRDFFRPLEDLSAKSDVLQAAMASSERIFALLDTPLEIEDPAAPRDLPDFRGEIAFEQVWFAYVDEDWVLRDVSFRVRPGESVAFVGATGAGKTSVISLIARFYEVQRGGIKVDGCDVRDFRQQDLRRRIGIVQQEPFIFSGTIAENITLHHPGLSRAEVEQAARYVNADRFISELPDGYDTAVQERGVTLSTGQKQLLALARTLVQNPDILLILDEATANIDTETEQLIQQALHKLMQGRTTMVIAHRLSTIKDVNRIMVMRKGEIVEQGSHRELLDQGGYYRRLYELLSANPVDPG